jgi:hypothetical protein
MDGSFELELTLVAGLIGEYSTGDPYLPPHRLTTMIRTTITTVSTRDTIMNVAQLPSVMSAKFVFTPPACNPPKTTLVHNSAMTNPKAVARDVEMVFLISVTDIFLSAAVSFFSSTIFDASSSGRPLTNDNSFPVSSPLTGIA